MLSIGIEFREESIHDLLLIHAELSQNHANRSHHSSHSHLRWPLADARRRAFKQWPLVVLPALHCVGLRLRCCQNDHGQTSAALGQ